MTTLNTSNRPSTEEGDKKQVAGAAAAGGIAGLLVGGPLAGIAVAGGAAYLAHNEKGQAGSLARDCGKVTVKAGDRALKFEKKHQVKQKTMRGVTKGLSWASKKMDNREKTTNRNKLNSQPTNNSASNNRKGEDINISSVVKDCGDVMKKAGSRVKNFDEKHKVTDKSLKGITKGLNWVSRKLDSPSTTKPNNNTVNCYN